MLKLQQRDTEKTIWLVGPEVKLGTASTNDFVLTGTGIEPHHCSIHVSNNEITVENINNSVLYLNEKPVKGKASVVEGDILRLVTQDFLIIDPNKKAEASTAAPSTASPVSGEATVFRMPAQPAKEKTQGSGWILQALHKSLQNKQYPIEGVMTLGRAPDCELHFSHDRLSRKHAELKIVDGKLMVRDLDSSNGTFKNGEKVKQATLHNGDTLAFDKLEFAVVGPNSQSDNAAQKMNQTVIRPAVTPSAIKQATKKTETAAPQPASNKHNTLGIVLVVAAVLILGVLGFVLLT